MQLLWRLQHGELPTTTDTKQAVVLIGTNDLTAYHQHQVLQHIAVAALTSRHDSYVCMCMLQGMQPLLAVVVRCELK